MFDNNITLAGDAGSSTTYALRSIVDGKSIRGDAAATLGNPKTLTVSHSQVSRGSAGIADRHLVRLDRTIVDGNGLAASASVYVVIESPRVVVTEAQQLDMITQLKNFLTAGNVDKLLNNEP